MQEIHIAENDSGQRLDKFLTKAFPGLPGALVYKYIRLKRVKVNGKRAEGGQKLAPGDVLQLYINDELLEARERADSWRRAAPDLDICYEDAHLLVVVKPFGLLCHPDEHGAGETLIGRIQAYLHGSGAWNPADARSFAPALCHRIDRNTGGLVMAAKTAEALRVMSAKIRERQVDKTYLCLVHGQLQPPAGRLTGYILRDTAAKQVTVLRHPAPGALTAITDYQTLETKGGLSLLACRLGTGRTHQIRAQLAAVGHPLVGDTKYGTAAQNRGLPFRHQALWAARIALGAGDGWGVLSELRGRVFEAPEPDFVRWLRTEYRPE
jgi:23S rRNA pseudouridine955/2504/2580 synthase